MHDDARMHFLQLFYMLRVVAALAMLSAHVQAVCPTSTPAMLVDPTAGKIYRLFGGPSTYQQAVAKCSSLSDVGSHPVVYNTRAEQALVEGYFRASIGSYWLGLKQEGNGGVW